MFALLIAIIYISFISLGLPDSLLGSAWPEMYPAMGVSVSYAGIISMIISAGTILSSLLSDRTTKRLGTGLVTGISVTMTALALLGFSLSRRFWMLVVFAVPYGLGAGGVDASLNNFVALHLKSRHMSWLHCMWGVGAAVSPYIMGYALSGGRGWSAGYLIVSVIQMVLAAIVLCTLPVWKRGIAGAHAQAQQSAANPSENLTADERALSDDGAEREQSNGMRKPLSAKEIVAIPGAVACFFTFFCYCALEQTAILWASSYMALYKQMAVQTAATFAGLFFIGITVGRGVNGFLTLKWNDRTLIRAGQTLIAAGIVCMFLPWHRAFTLAGLLVIGLGCAPVYPCIIHMTPALFGADKSQAMIGVQMASAYTGSCLMPPFFGILAQYVGVWLLPVFFAVMLALMVLMHEIVVCKTRKKPPVISAAK